MPTPTARTVGTGQRLTTIATAVVALWSLWLLARLLGSHHTIGPEIGGVIVAIHKEDVWQLLSSAHI